MQFENVQDMEQKHDQEIVSEEELSELLEYNLNDVKATAKFLELTEDKIELRRKLKTQYGLNCLNYSDSKIGSELMLLLYCGATGKKVNSVRKERTVRKEFKFEEFIFDYVNFQTKEFNELLNYLKGIEETELKDSFNKEFTYEGVDYFYGTGGLHANRKEGVYESDEEHIIVDADVC